MGEYWLTRAATLNQLQVPPLPPEHLLEQFAIVELAAVSPAWYAALCILARQLASAPEYWRYCEQVLEACAMAPLTTCCLTEFARLAHESRQLCI